jgi:hypothetical protein
VTIAVFCFSSFSWFTSYLKIWSRRCVGHCDRITIPAQAAPWQGRSAQIWAQVGPGGARRWLCSWHAGGAPWRKRRQGGGGWAAAALRPASCSVAAGLYGPFWVRPGQFGPGLPRSLVRSATAKAVEAVPSRVAAVLLPPPPLHPFSSSRPCSGDHS